MVDPRGRRLWRFVLLALLAHGVLFVAIRRGAHQLAATAPLGGKFVKRRPLPQQVLRRQIEEPVRGHPLRRLVVQAHAYARATPKEAERPAAPDVLQATGGQVLSRRPFRPGVGVASIGRRTRLAAVAIEVEAENQMDPGLELMDVEGLDTGRYRAIVMQDPGNRRNLSGYVRLAAVGIRSAMEAAASNEDNVQMLYQLDGGNIWMTEWRQDGNVQALVELAQDLEAQTRLRATVDASVFLDDGDWLATPFVLLTSSVDFVPTAREVQNLGRYLVSGGFAYVEVVGTNHHQDLYHGRVGDVASLRNLVEEALVQQGLHRGRDWEITPLSLRHALFSSYHDIPDLPLPYWSIVRQFVVNAHRFNPDDFAGWANLRPPSLEAIQVRGRLAGVYSQQNYRDFWSRRLERTLSTANAVTRSAYTQHLSSRTTSDPALRLGVNIVVYALTQEGSLARQIVAR